MFIITPKILNQQKHKNPKIKVLEKKFGVFHVVFIQFVLNFQMILDSYLIMLLFYSR